MYLILQAAYQEIEDYRHLCKHEYFLHRFPFKVRSAYCARRRQFASLCIVSKLFCKIAQPLLYKVFHNIEDGCSRMRRLDCFLTTLIDRPDLAAQVQEISLELYYNPNYSDYRTDKAFTESIEKLQRAALRRAISQVFPVALNLHRPGRSQASQYGKVSQDFPRTGHQNLSRVKIVITINCPSFTVLRAGKLGKT